MSDYISRESVLALADDFELTLPDDEIFFSYIPVTAVEKLPAADVRPAVRGRWETVMLDHELMGCRPTAHYCSECHQITWFRTFYCPNCGADMRGEL